MHVRRAGKHHPDTPPATVMQIKVVCDTPYFWSPSIVLLIGVNVTVTWLVRTI